MATATPTVPAVPSSVGDPGGPPAFGRLGAGNVLALSACFGLAAGWLEVGTRLLARAVSPAHRLNMMSRHYVWTIPLADLLVFAAIGLPLVVVARRWPRAGWWIAPRLLGALALMPALMVAWPQVYPWAWMILAAGIAMRLAPPLERRPARWRPWRKWGTAAMAAAVPIVAGLVFGERGYRRWQEASRPLPPGDPPNVLLIVLDTVRADHLGLYGYPRDTSQALFWLAKRGITFTEARSTAPWTLASHASLFSGRLPHELGVKWVTPLRGDFPTLAGYLASRGYATAGFVANTEYCSSDTGLDRGFAHYEDYAADLVHLRPLRFAVLFDAGWSAIAATGRFVSERLGSGPWHDRVEIGLKWLLGSYRKDAAEVNREFLDWLAGRREPRRPYFAFLNYYDAHAPYILPDGAPLRFGPGPRTLEDFTLLVQRWKAIDKRKLSPKYRDLVLDSYDNCLGHLDRALVRLIQSLRRSGGLDRTLIIVTADHGEELGEHGLFEHGESLYRPEIRVPLVIVPPGHGPSPEVVPEVVSLRDLPATIVDLVGLSAGSPLPGESMARSWGKGRTGPAGPVASRPAFSELAEPNPTSPSLGLSPATRGPLTAIAEGAYAYIRNEGDGTEELFDERNDPDESRDLARDEGMGPTLQAMRQHAAHIRSTTGRRDRRR